MAGFPSVFPQRPLGGFGNGAWRDGMMIGDRFVPQPPRAQPGFPQFPQQQPFPPGQPIGGMQDVMNRFRPAQPDPLAQFRGQFGNRPPAQPGFPQPPQWPAAGGGLLPQPQRPPLFNSGDELRAWIAANGGEPNKLLQMFMNPYAGNHLLSLLSGYGNSNPEPFPGVK